MSKRNAPRKSARPAAVDQSTRHKPRRAIWATAGVFVAVAAGAIWWSQQPGRDVAEPGDDPTAFEPQQTARGDTVLAPGLERRYVGPLRDAYRRIDPAADGWPTEAFSSHAAAQLNRLGKLLATGGPLDPKAVGDLADPQFAGTTLRPSPLEQVFSDKTFTVRRFAPGDRAAAPPIGLASVLNGLIAPFANATDLHTKFKLFKVQRSDSHADTKVLFQADGTTDGGRLQINATWRCRWTAIESTQPRLISIEVLAHEEVVQHGIRGPLLVDCTESVLGATDSYRRQLLHSTDHWRARLARDHGLDVVANHGLALGDVNGDGRDDLYLCQQGGLPNRLYIQQPDGTLKDATATSGADWLDLTASALLVDLDNDGDRDLIVAQELRVLFMSNDGTGKFRLEFGLGTRAQTFSIAAADYDADGRLDVFICGYNPSNDRARTGALGEPMPYHDANNGGANMLLRSLGNWNYVDVAEKVGLGQNNTRFSFAASWEDYDNDGDLDLYVANDYGRNNLYRNDGGKFVDVAAALDVEDMSSGMSASWADYNNDGWMDLYVSNMFSSAGNRITYQRQFKQHIDEATRKMFQRHARGNSLFENDRRGGFRDVSVAAGVTMGRWAWGSKWIDLNNDTLDDLVVANGFISTADSGDL